MLTWGNNQELTRHSWVDYLEKSTILRTIFKGYTTSGTSSHKGDNVFPAWNRPPLIWKRLVLLIGDKLNTRVLLAVSKCLKDRALHIRTVYVNSLYPNGIVWWLGNPQFRKVSRVVSWFVYKGLCRLHKLFETFVFSPLSAHSLTPYFHRM